ncbi:hypothetical protein [Psychromonas sp.]|uniref:hypothetical protein n=1 Tax=Psychromonas sp. TaxID=1884585 RepID=UPI003568BAFC
MKKTLFIHIGSFKTGTSALQDFISVNKDALQQEGVYIPTSTGKGHHELVVALLRRFTDFNARWAGYDSIKGSDCDNIWNQLIKEIDDTSCSKVLVSSELFCDIVNEHCRDHSQEIGEYISNKLKNVDVKIICYFRDIKQYAKSMYKELLKVSSLKLNYSQQLCEFINNKSIHIYPNIYLDFYSNLFGREALSIYEYKKSLLYRGSLEHDFFKREPFNISLDGFVFRNYILNESIPDSLVPIKLALNQVGIKDVAFNRYLSDMLRSSSEEFSVDYSLLEKLNTMVDEEADKYDLNFTPFVKEDLDIKSNISQESMILTVQNAIIIKQNRNIEHKLDLILGPKGGFNIKVKNKFKKLLSHFFNKGHK